LTKSYHGKSQCGKRELILAFPAIPDRDLWSEECRDGQ